MKNLEAFTEAGCEYPAYISINETEDGDVEFVVRSRPEVDSHGDVNEGPTASIVLDARHGISERFLFPVLSIARQLVKNSLCPGLDSHTREELYRLMPAALRRKIMEEIEATI
jgi:hypothetical protein